MRSLDKLITIGRLILLYESLIAGLVFIAVAITVIFNPAMASSALNIGFLSQMMSVFLPLTPRENLALFVTTASLLLGVANLSLAWAAVYVKAERRKM